LNYLVHLYLSDPTPECRLGNLMGDFVKGRLEDAWAPEILRGIRQHRRVDAFAHRSAVFRRSKARIHDSFGHCKGVLVDVFYDHFLARNWIRYSTVPLDLFARDIYRLLEENRKILPPGLQEVAPRMIAHNWLVSYRETQTIGRVLDRISERLSRPNPIALGIGELHRHYDGLQADCDLFLAEAEKFLRDGQAE
jgi:acyl carrier protein phosphodiesterase